MSSSRDASRAGAAGEGEVAGRAPIDIARARAQREGERGRDAAEASGLGPARPQRPPPVRSVADVARRVPDVSHAVLLTREGARVEEGGYESEVLEGEAVFAGLLARELGAALSAGELRSAAIEGSRRHLLLVASATHVLAATARPDADVGAVAAALRHALPGAS